MPDMKHQAMETSADKASEPDRRVRALEDKPDTRENRAVSISYRLELGELVGSIWKRMIRQRWLWFVLVAALLVPVVSDPSWGNLLIGIGVISVCVFIVPLAFGWLMYRRHLESFDVRIDEGGVEVLTGVAESHLKWSFFMSVRESRWAYEMAGRRGFLLIPKRAFRDVGSEGEFRELCMQHGVTRFVER